MTLTVTKCFMGLVLLSSALLAGEDQTATTTNTTTDAKPPDPVVQTAPANPADGTIPIDKRVFGVLPNYRTADGTATFQPISAKQKMMIGIKDSFDYPVYFTSAMFAGINQLEDTSPQFGQGLKGYAKRYVTAYVDQTLGNLMTESLFPIMLKQDPRYFSVGKSYGSTGKRVRYALSRVLLCRDDRGRTVVNYSELLGNSTATAISNLYYTENRNAKDNVQKLGIQIGTDALSNVLKEFWPDIKRKYFNKKSQGD